MIIGIVAVDENWGIGKDNQLLFHIKEDMQFFKEKTLGNVVCMGKNTFLSLPNQQPLKGRENVVLSSNSTFANCMNVHSFEELLEYINLIKHNFDVYIIGGAQLYEAMLPYYDKILVTKVFTKKEADAFFPDLSQNNSYIIEDTSGIIKTNSYNIQFITYVKKELMNEN